MYCCVNVANEITPLVVLKSKRVNRRVLYMLKHISINVHQSFFGEKLGSVLHCNLIAFGSVYTNSL